VKKAIVYWFVAGLVIGTLDIIFSFFIFSKITSGVICDASSLQMNTDWIIVTIICFGIVTAILGAIYQSVFGKK